MSLTTAAAAARSNLVPLHEYLLQGSILEMQRDLLLHRLNGLCDTVDTGPEKFNDHEMVYQIGGNANIAPTTFRVRRALDHPEAPWHIRYLGQGDLGKHTLVRNCVEAGTSTNVTQFLHEMGFRLDHEYTVKGHIFRKGRMKITVAKIFRLEEQGNTDSQTPLSSSWLVELSVEAPHGQDQIHDDMKNFAEQLKPLVQLEKPDHRKPPSLQRP